MGSPKVGKDCAYLEAIESNILEQPAVKVWLKINPNYAPPSRVEHLRRWASPKPFVCRMLGIETASHAVIAKRCKLTAGLQEKRFYEEILPQLPMPSLKYYGSFQEGDEHLWLFLEDAGGRQFSFHKPEDRKIAVQWLINLHTHSARLGKPSRLIERGPAYYLERLTNVQSTLELHADRDVFSAAERQVLAASLDLLDSTASIWESISALYERLPQCVIHGDFKSKNIHLRSDQQQASIFVFDWEYAGWGTPGIDMWRLDEEEYLLAIRPYWPHVDISTVREMQNLGSVFRSVDSYFWETRRLNHPIHATAKIKLNENLSLFNVQMADALQTFSTQASVRRQAAG